jgi:hypothetical protein
VADLLAASVMNMASMWEFPALGPGRRRARWDGAWIADSGLPTRMFNRVTVTRPLPPAASEEFAERIIEFYEGAEDGDYLVNDSWGTLDLERFGFERWWDLPLMVRTAGGSPPPEPEELRIEEVRSEEQLLVFEHVLVDGFPIEPLRHTEVPGVFDRIVLSDPSLRMWVAFKDGEAVGTAVALIGHGVVGVYLVAVVEGARRRGFGESLTWRARLTNPALPSTLQASSMGEPLYARMGYRTIATCRTWVH